MAGFPHYLSLCVIVKNEGPYLAEWLEYHHLMGVTQFVIYDNNSTDNTREILSPYYDKGWVEYVHWPEYPGQLSAYQHCVNNYKDTSFWIGFIDMDEFIVPLATTNLPEFLKAYEGANGLGINWLMFGPSGNKRKPLGLQMKNYLFRSAKDHPENLHIKTIANPRNIVGTGANPHYFLYANGKSAVDENQKLIGEGAYSRAHSSNKIRINHYITRSEEEFVAKLQRGRATTPIPRSMDLASLGYYEELSKEYDPLMLNYANQIREKLHDKPL